jgi:hypothetical protein
LFTIVRLSAPGSFFRRALIATVITFGIVWALLSVQVWCICENQSGWKSQPLPQCDLGRGVAIAQMISEDLLFNDYIGLLMYFSRRSRGLPSHLRSILPHLQSQIVMGAKSPGVICLLCISDHHDCQSCPCILHFHGGRAEGGYVCSCRGAVSVFIP